MKHTIFLLAVATVIACAGPAPSPDTNTDTNTNTSTPTPADTKKATLSQRCTNAQYGISVSYPEGWHTNDGSVLPACSVFDPAPIDIPRNSELPFDLAVVLRVETDPVEQLTRSSQWERVLATAQRTIGGRVVTRVEVEATGEGLADRGMRSLRYVVDLGGGRSLVASTHATDDAYEENKQTLERIVESIAVN